MNGSTIHQKCKNMEKLLRNQLHLVGSAGTLENLCEFAKQRLYWAQLETSESTRYESRMGKVYDVSNRNGLVPDMVIIQSKVRCSLYRIKE
jgi:hypothetical protein